MAAAGGCPPVWSRGFFDEKLEADDMTASRSRHFSVRPTPSGRAVVAGGVIKQHLYEDILALAWSIRNDVQGVIAANTPPGVRKKTVCDSSAIVKLARKIDENRQQNRMSSTPSQRGAPRRPLSSMSSTASTARAVNSALKGANTSPKESRSTRIALLGSDLPNRGSAVDEKNDGALVTLVAEATQAPGQCTTDVPVLAVITPGDGKSKPEPDPQLQRQPASQEQTPMQLQQQEQQSQQQWQQQHQQQLQQLQQHPQQPATAATASVPPGQPPLVHHYYGASNGGYQDTSTYDDCGGRQNRGAPLQTTAAAAAAAAATAATAPTGSFGSYTSLDANGGGASGGRGGGGYSNGSLAQTAPPGGGLHRGQGDATPPQSLPRRQEQPLHQPRLAQQQQQQQHQRDWGSSTTPPRARPRGTSPRHLGVRPQTNAELSRTLAELTQLLEGARIVGPRSNAGNRTPSTSPAATAPLHH
mmetsp:Transcript_11627/g.25598  ORF Transcript_11627/g.25598 Transcript_11627/m.25598 type:complete len:472 (+) Transcript_11627:155-1570(+)